MEEKHVDKKRDSDGERHGQIRDRTLDIRIPMGMNVVESHAGLWGKNKMISVTNTNTHTHTIE